MNTGERFDKQFGNSPIPDVWYSLLKKYVEDERTQIKEVLLAAMPEGWQIRRDTISRIIKEL